MAGQTCDLCQAAPCGGVAVILDDPPRHIPTSAWGKVCFMCWRRLGPVVPTSPLAPARWQQWVADMGAWLARSA